MGDASDRPPTRPDLDALFERLKAEGGAGRGLPTAARASLGNTTIQWLLAALVTLTLAYLTFSGHGWIEVLSAADLGVHEFGHLLTAWAPDLICWLAGSFLQVALPLGLCAYFFFARHDRFATILTLAWAAENLNNVSVYIYDATRMELALFNDDGSGSGHDWHNILGRLGLLGSTDGLAYFVRFLSVLGFVIALGLAAWWFVAAHHERRDAA